MGLMSSRALVARAHVLVVETPGAFRTRVRLEQAIAAARWCQTETAADADVLVVVGSPGHQLTAIADRTWGQMSEPRARVQITDEANIAHGLDQARAGLLAPAGPSSDQHHKDSTPEHAHADHDTEDAAGDDDASHDAHEHSDHDHGSMSPDGIPLAEGADDRDGLEMDALHLPLGPVLNHWPAGVVLRLTLNGDVVTSATGVRLDSPTHLPTPGGPVQAARLLDSACSLLSLAGLPGLSARARHLRDRCLFETSVDPQSVHRLAARIDRHRVLRWLWRGTTLTDDTARTVGLHEQLVGLVDRAARVLDGDAAASAKPWPTLDALADLMGGQELAAVRLWVAACGLDAVQNAEREAAHDQ